MQGVHSDEIFIQAAKGYKLMWPMRAQVIPCANSQVVTHNLTADRSIKKTLMRHGYRIGIWREAISYCI